MLKIGDEAPDFTLPNHLGEETSLSQFRGKKIVVLAFYPLNWTPVCSGQIPGYQEVLDRFGALKTQVLALSVDSIPSHKSWAYSMGGINYPLLSDFWPHGKVAELYGVMTDAGHTERAIFVIDTEGIIRYIDHHDITHEPDVEVLFAELAKCG